MKRLFLFHQKKLWLLPFLFLTIFSCRKEYSVENQDNNPLAAGNWQFKEGGTQFAGDIDTAFISDANQLKELHLMGTSNDGTQQFNLILFGNSFTPGSYKASAFQVTFQYGNSVPLLYDASQLNGEFIVTITSINDAMVTGTFSGTALKGDSVAVNIVEGVFKAEFNTTPQPVSSGVLGVSNGSCSSATISGTYTQGIVMNPGNKVTVQVTVAQPGTYNIYTDTTNGVVFYAKGNFSTTGVQNVILQGAGTPVNEGVSQFVVHYGTSQCSFNITFQKGLAPPNDYLPLTSQTGFNNWTYVQNGTDTYYTQVLSGSYVVNGLSYTVVGSGTNTSDVQNDTAGIFRKGNGIYYLLFDYSSFTSAQQPLRIETIILKDNVPVGTTWDGPEVPVTVNGISLQYHIKFTILEKAVPATVGTFAFPDVIKVKGELYSGTTNLGVGMEWWYAKNVGIVYEKDISAETIIQNYQIFP